jgi:hypothetical protein
VGRRTGPEPTVQSTYMKQFAAAVERLGGRAESVRRADPELFRRIEEARRTSWLPVGLNVRMVEAIHSVVGPARATAFFAEQVHGQFDTPLWRNFIDGGVRLFGLDPGSLAKWLPHAYGVIFRHCGRWQTRREGETEVSVSARMLPDALVRHALWLDSIRAGMHALFLLCKVEGRADLEGVDVAAGHSRIVLSWKERE